MLNEVTFFPDKIMENKNNPDPFIHPTAMIKNCKLGQWTEIGKRSYYAETQFDDFSYDTGNSRIINAEIGKFCSVASHVKINNINPYVERIMWHHYMFSNNLFGFSGIDDEDLIDHETERKCIIGNDVWIGHASIIMPGVKIGNGAIIGSHSVVTEDIMPYEIVAGIPAKVTCMRFEDDTIKKLETIKWWDWDYETIRIRLTDFNNVNYFIRKYSGITTVKPINTL